LNEVSDPDARSLAALSGEAHIVRSITAESSARIQRSRTSRLYTIPSTDCAAAYLNIAKEPFSDVRVRQALAWSLDRDEIVNVSYNGLARTAP
jgi:peptide/nickel transport system substrate-binding protein